MERSNQRARPSGLSVPCRRCNTSIPYDPMGILDCCPACDPSASQMAGDQLESDDFESALNNDDESASPDPSTENNRASPQVIIERSQDQDMANSSEDESDEFVDAHEELTSEVGDGEEMAIDGDENVAGVGSDEDMAVDDDDHMADGNDHEDEEAPTSESEPQVIDDPDDSGDGGDEDVLEHPDAEDADDLFASTFGNTKGPENEKDADESDDEVQIVSSISKTKAAPTKSSKKSDLIGPEHTKGCKPGRGPSTPRDSPAPPAPPPAPGPPDPHRDLSDALKRLRRWHYRAIEFIPRLPLPAHRFWIGVLNLDMKKFSQEKHFTWMKGNRFTTVETVWNSYRNATGVEEFVLLLGYEKVGFRDKAMELDYFNNKKIVFRAVNQGDPEAKGREISANFVPKVVEVVDLDDD